jgi:uncharacterized protein (DUF1778 family)
MLPVGNGYTVGNMKKVNLRLDVTEAERDMIRRAAALSGYRSMAEFCRDSVLRSAHAADSGHRIISPNVATNVAEKKSGENAPQQDAE